MNASAQTGDEASETIIVAVSGGVDSIVMLHKLVQTHEGKLIVVHVDHGIRPDSHADATFVAQLARGYRLEFIRCDLHLGPNASEDTARQARWKCLRDAMKEYDAARIATAHHADDRVETMIINISRGTGWRGIASLRETAEVMRPVLGCRKRELIDYARAHKLMWREDSTNESSAYLRNYIRHTIMPKLSSAQFDAFLNLSVQQQHIRQEIEGLLPARHAIPSRYYWVMWHDEVAYEMLRRYFGSLTQREYARLLIFIRTARTGKKYILTTGNIVGIKDGQLIVLEG